MKKHVIEGKSLATEIKKAARQTVLRALFQVIPHPDKWAVNRESRFKLVRKQWTGKQRKIHKRCYKMDCTENLTTDMERMQWRLLPRIHRHKKSFLEIKF